MVHATPSLSTLVAQMEPQLSDETYLFCSISQARRKTLQAHPLLELNEESGGISLALRAEDLPAEKLEGHLPSRLIRLPSDSKPEANRLLACLSAQLAMHGIPIEPMSGFNCGYIFVSDAEAERCLRLLHELKDGYSEMITRHRGR